MGLKYRIVETTGCTAFDFQVNGVSLSDMPQKDQDELLDYLLQKVKEGIAEQTILLQQVVQLFQYDDYEHDNQVCGQCGDSVSSTTWNI